MESEREREQNEERPQQDRLESFFPDYHLVVMRQCSHMVSTVMARHIERELDRWPRPRWIRFVDVTGARFRVRADAIEGLEQSTRESRELLRGSAKNGTGRIRPSPFRFDRGWGRGRPGWARGLAVPPIPAGYHQGGSYGPR